MSPKNMRQVYKAACGTGNPAVLQLLLQWLLEKHPEQAEQREQLAALLRGAAAAGDYGVMRDVLACGAVVNSKSGSGDNGRDSRGSSSGGASGGSSSSDCLSTSRGSGRDVQVDSGSDGATSSSGVSTISSGVEHGSDGISSAGEHVSGSTSSSSSSSQHYLPSLDWGMLLPRQWLDAILDALPALELMTEYWQWKHTSSGDKGVQYRLAMADLLLYAAGRLGGFKPALLAQELSDMPEGSLAIKGSKDGWNRLRLGWLGINLRYSKLKFLEGGPLATANITLTGQTSSMVLQEVQEYRRQQGEQKVPDGEGANGVNTVTMSLTILGAFKEQVEQAFGDGDAAAVKWLSLWQQYQALGSSAQMTKWIPLDDKIVAHPRCSADRTISAAARRDGVDERWLKSLNELAEELQLPWEIHCRLLQPMVEEDEGLVGKVLEHIGKLLQDIKRNRAWAEEALQHRGAWGEVPDVIKRLVVRALGSAGENGLDTGKGSSSSSRAGVAVTDSCTSTDFHDGSGSSHVYRGSSYIGMGNAGSSSLNGGVGTAAAGGGGGTGTGGGGAGVDGIGDEGRAELGVSVCAAVPAMERGGAGRSAIKQQSTAGSSDMSSDELTQAATALLVWLHNLEAVYANILGAYYILQQQMKWVMSAWEALPPPEDLKRSEKWLLTNLRPLVHPEVAVMPTPCPASPSSSSSGTGGSTGGVGSREGRAREAAPEGEREVRGGLLYEQLVQQHVERQYEAKRVKQQLARAARYQQQQEQQGVADVSGSLGEGLAVGAAAAGGAEAGAQPLQGGLIDAIEVDLKGPFELGDLCFHSETWRALKHLGKEQGIGESWLKSFISAQDHEQMIHHRTLLQDEDGSFDLNELMRIYQALYVGDDAARDVLNGLPALVLPLAAKVPECLGCLEEGLTKAWSYVEQKLGELQGKLGGQLDKMASVRGGWKGLEVGVKQELEGGGCRGVEVKAQQQQEGEQGGEQHQQEQEEGRKEQQQQQEEKEGRGGEEEQQQQEEAQGGKQQQQQQQEEKGGEQPLPQQQGLKGEVVLNNDQPQQQQQKGPLMLKQQLMLQCFTLPGMCTEGEAAMLFRIGLRNQLNDFVGKAALHQRTGDPNWVVPKRGVGDSVLDVVREALCCADGRLLQQCVEIIKVRQATEDNKVWGVREEGEEEDGGEYGYGELLRALPPFRWLCQQQQEWWLGWYKETEEEVQRLERQVRYMPQLGHGVLRPRAEPRAWRAWERGPGEAAVAEEVLEVVLQLLDAPDLKLAMLTRWLGKLKPQSTVEDVAVVRELLLGLGAREKVPVGATAVGIAGRNKRLWVKGMVDVLGAMVTWYGKARVAERAAVAGAEPGEEDGDLGEDEDLEALWNLVN